MNKSQSGRWVFGLVIVIAGALHAPGHARADKHGEVRDICENYARNQGLKGKLENVEVSEPRSGGFSVTGQMHKKSNRVEFNCVTDGEMIVKEFTSNPVGGGGGGDGAQAPAEAQVACAAEADRHWGLAAGTAVPLSAKSTGSGMFEVTVAGGKHRGVCTVTEGGDVKGLMDAK